MPHLFLNLVATTKSPESNSCFKKGYDIDTVFDGVYFMLRTYEIHQPHDGQYSRRNSPVNTKKVFFVIYDL